MSNHLITKATTVLNGAAVLEAHKALYDGRSGHVVNFMRYLKIGAAVAAVATGFISAATGALLPNAGTLKYTPATDGVAPLNGGTRRPVVQAARDSLGGTHVAYTMDVARNVQLTATHGSSIVAMTVSIFGLDWYGQLQTELLTLTATGTSKTVAGKKTWSAIYEMDLAATGNSQANTLNLGWANVLGLPYRIALVSELIPFGNNALDTSGTVVKADDTAPATNVTGDVRGTYTPSSAPDGTKTYEVWLTPDDPSTTTGLFGQPPV